MAHLKSRTSFATSRVSAPPTRTTSRYCHPTECDGDLPPDCRAAPAALGSSLRRRHSELQAEEIVAKLRQVDVLRLQGKTVGEAIRSVGVSEVTYYRWGQEP